MRQAKCWRCFQTKAGPTPPPPPPSSLETWKKACISPLPRTGTSLGRRERSDWPVAITHSCGIIGFVSKGRGTTTCLSATVRQANKKRPGIFLAACPPLLGMLCFQKHCRAFNVTHTRTHAHTHTKPVLRMSLTHHFAFRPLPTDYDTRLACITAESSIKQVMCIG